MHLLAGMLDTDGSHFNDNAYLISNCNILMLADVARLARGLGLYSTFRSKNVLLIHGPGVQEIPVRMLLPVSLQKVTDIRQPYNIEICPRGKGKYFGFQLDGNHRFMLGDYTVTHNTAVAIAMPLTEKSAYRRSSLNVIVVPQNICMQWKAEIKKFAGDIFKVLVLIDYTSIFQLTIHPTSVAQYDIVLTTPVYFATLANLCESKNINPRRIIVDEADTMASMISKKMPGTMTWFVSATIDRFPEAKSGMIQVGKEIKTIEDRDTAGSTMSALTTKRGGTLRSEESGTYEIPARLLRSGERVCRCEPDWITESFEIPQPVKNKIVVSNVIIDVLANLTYARLLKPKQLESANARDFSIA